MPSVHIGCDCCGGPSCRCCIDPTRRTFRVVVHNPLCPAYNMTVEMTLNDSCQLTLPVPLPDYICHGEAADGHILLQISCTDFNINFNVSLGWTACPGPFAVTAGVGYSLTIPGPAPIDCTILRTLPITLISGSAEDCTVGDGSPCQGACGFNTSFVTVQAI